MKKTKKRGKQHKILFIEDEPSIVSIYQEYLTKHGFEFVSTKDIQEALDLTETFKPDLVLLDIIIPKPENTIAEQGWEYLEKIKRNQKHKNIPVLVFTNLDTPQDRQRSEDMGAAGFIFKCDCTPAEVTEAINQVISGTS
jgi:DNA-binding response OmpR family regulator